MVQMWISSTFGLGTLPFNQIKTRRASIITNLKECCTTKQPWNLQPTFKVFVSYFTKVPYNLEVKELVKGERPLEAR